MAATTINPGAVPACLLRSREVLETSLNILAKRTDRLFGWLTGLEWIACIVFSLWISPRSWVGEFSQVHLHVWTAIFLGGIIASLPLTLIVMRPGAVLTRHVIAASQMLMVGLLVHLTGGRIETHFGFFGLLAFLAFYRDWKVLATATLVAGLDHFVRGMYWPMSIFGVSNSSPWRAAEHIGWVIFEVIFLADFIRHSRKQGLVLAQRQAELEGVNDRIAREVAAQTADLTTQIKEREKAQSRLHLQNEVSALLGSDAPMDYICRNTLRVIAETLGWQWGSSWDINPNMQVMRMTECWTNADDLRDFETISRSMLLRQGEGIPGRVWASRDCHWMAQLDSSAGLPRFEVARATGLAAAFAFPVLQEQEVVAVFEFWSSQIVEPERDLLDSFATMGRALGSYFAHKKDEKAIRDSERRYRLMFENNPHPMWVYDLETLRFLAVNRSAVQKYGYSVDEFCAMTIADIYPPDEARELLQKIPLVPHESEDPKQLRHRTRDGRLLDVEITSNMVEWKSRPADLVLANDVTERHRELSEKAMLEVQLRHAQKLESIGQLAAGIAHEINTPTQYIGDNTRFLKDAFQDFTVLLERYDRLLKLAELQTVPREVVEQLAGEIRAVDTAYLLQEIPNAIQQSIEGVERVSTLVAAMKEFSHPGNKEKSPLDLNKSIESTIAVARNEWKYVADLHTDFDRSLPPVSCLAGEFNQVILNLVVNAAHAIGEATENGSRGKGLITIRTRDLPDWVEIEVRDSGTGIPEHARPRIFDPFFTTKEIGRGTGQGLAIAYSVIVEKHGGSINFETEMGKGTAFKICLPHDGKTLAAAKAVMA